MNWDRIEGNWNQFKGTVKRQWGKLTDDQLDVIAGKRDQLFGKIQETYGISREETEKQLSAWQERQNEMYCPPKRGGAEANASGHASFPNSPQIHRTKESS